MSNPHLSNSISLQRVQERQCPGKASWRRWPSPSRPWKGEEAVPQQSWEEGGGKDSGVRILAQTHTNIGHPERHASRTWLREGARQPTHLQHVPRDVLLTAVTADAELGVVVGLAVGQPVPATRQAIRTRRGFTWGPSG